MILTGIWLFSIAFLLLRLGVAWANVFSWPVLKHARGHAPSGNIAILIPARNEAHTLPRLLASLGALPSPTLSFRVLDDHSTDGTADVVRAFAARDGRFHLHAGEPLPPGWLGKNWACHQLAHHALADGPDAILYLDADVATIDPALIPTLDYQAHRLDAALISIFPNQEMHTLGEELTVPLMHYLLLSLLPLWLVRYLGFPSMAAANGQCMWFKASEYRTHQWHQQLKNIVIEDIAAMRLVKSSGLHGMVFCGGGLIRTRMYTSLREGINGFAKNLLAGFGGSAIGLTIWLLLLALPLALIPWLSAPFIPSLGIAAGVFLAMLGIRVAISLTAGQSVGKNVVLHPLQMGILAVIAVLSIVRKYTGTQEWKGRIVSVPRG